MFFVLGFNINDDLKTVRRACLYNLEKKIKLESFGDELFETQISFRKFCLFRDMFFYINEDKYNEIVSYLGYEKRTKIDYKDFLKKINMYEYCI